LPGSNLENATGGGQDELPRNFLNWLEIRRIKRGLEVVTNREIAEAKIYFRISAIDLPDGAAWTDGRENPLIWGDKSMCLCTYSRSLLNKAAPSMNIQPSDLVISNWRIDLAQIFR
jgi:hypothetical protein